MAAQSVLLASLTSRIKGDHAYSSGVKICDRLFCTIEPDNKHNVNTIVVRLGNDDIIGHVPETLAKQLFTFMKRQQIEIMDSEVPGNPRPAPEAKWVIGGGIEITCKYRLCGPKSVKNKFELCLNDFQNSFAICIYMYIYFSFFKIYRKTPKIL